MFVGYGLAGCTSSRPQRGAHGMCGFRGREAIKCIHNRAHCTGARRAPCVAGRLMQATCGPQWSDVMSYS